MSEEGKQAALAIAEQMRVLREENEALRVALKAMVCMSDRGPEPKKFDEALSWRENDLKARALADAALAKAGPR